MIPISSILLKCLWVRVASLYDSSPTSLNPLPLAVYNCFAVYISCGLQGNTNCDIAALLEILLMIVRLKIDRVSSTASHTMTQLSDINTAVSGPPLSSIHVCCLGWWRESIENVFYVSLWRRYSVVFVVRGERVASAAASETAGLDLCYKLSAAVPV